MGELLQMEQQQQPVDVRRAYIEGRLELCRDDARRSLIEMGRWLNRAKSEGVVPHGDWTDWVQRHAGINERTAQRLMRIARELPEGSPMERLGVAKLEEILKLPEGERETVAAGAESKSSRAVRDEVAALRAERDEALRFVRTQKEAAARLQREAEDAARALAAERAKPAQVVEQAPADYLQIKQEAEQLRRRLAESEAEADRLADELDKRKLQEAGTDAADDLCARIVSSIGGFMAMMGQLPEQLRRSPDRLSRDDWSLTANRVNVLYRWCQLMLGANPYDDDRY